MSQEFTRLKVTNLSPDEQSRLNELTTRVSHEPWVREFVRRFYAELALERLLAEIRPRPKAPSSHTPDVLTFINKNGQPK
jgi:hypothetical protein